ncbi:MAG: hypothetical protein ACRDTE_01995 [Pseudonocardiaceae bacterium]
MSSSGGFGADPAAMEDIAGTLHSGVARLDSLADSLPGMPDGGELSGDMAAALSNFARCAAELVMGISTAGDHVAAGGAEYAEADDSGRRGFENQFE